MKKESKKIKLGRIKREDKDEQKTFGTIHRLST